MSRRSPTQMSMLSPMSARQISKMRACEWLIYLFEKYRYKYKYIYIYIYFYIYGYKNMSILSIYIYRNISKKNRQII